MPSKHELCQQCGSILKTDVCLKCGFNPSANNAEFLNPDTEEATDQLENKNKEVVEVVEEHQQVRSIFTEMAVASGKVEVVEEIKTRRSVITPILLSVALLALAGLSYWRFIYYTPDFVSPLVLSASNIKDADGNVTAISENSELEKTIELDSQLVEGNFEALDFAQFGSPTTTAFIHAFDLRNIFDRFGNLSKFEELQKDFEVEDDDFDVYFSKGVAYFVPGENLDTWGFAIGVNNREFVESRLEDFVEAKENSNYKYAKYSAELVELEVNERGELEAEEATVSLDIEEDSETEDEENTESDDSTTEAEGEDSNVVLFLLVSNSNEYLDQMKESSEGNLNNLAREISFAQAKADLPKVGEVFVFKDKESQIWNVLADIVATKYSYVGLDKVLKTIQATGAVFYSVDSKLRIALTEN